MKILKIIFYAFILFFVCLIVSVIVKAELGVEGDYLSAFSTLVAAIVAYNLYSDWKEQHKLKLWEKYTSDSKKILSDLIDCQKRIGEFHIRFMASTSTHIPYDSDFRQYKIKFRDTVQDSQKFLFEYKIFLSTVQSGFPLERHIEEVDKLRALAVSVLNELMEINKGATNLDYLEILIESLFQGKISEFTVDFRILTDSSIPKYYYGFFDAVE